MGKIHISFHIPCLKAPLFSLFGQIYYEDEEMKQNKYTFDENDYLVAKDIKTPIQKLLNYIKFKIRKIFTKKYKILEIRIKQQ